MCTFDGDVCQELSLETRLELLDIELKAIGQVIVDLRNKMQRALEANND